MENLWHVQEFLNNLIEIECLLSQVYSVSFRVHIELKDGQFIDIFYDKGFNLNPLNTEQ